ncbi:MAG TPA: DUF2147 domain-containing protein [Rudaea sp.]|nr:DUF2147 domain-containing protein [Rudaea sp.]
MPTIRSLLCAATASLALSTIAAADPAPTGTWKTIDDDTHEPKAIVEISEHDGVLSGRIVRLFREPGEEANPRCKECPGERHDQPVLGMTILWNMHRDGDVWDGGEILDPEEGKTYRCKLHLAPGGEVLEVRGYIGFSLLGRTQLWQRVAGGDAR